MTFYGLFFVVPLTSTGLTFQKDARPTMARDGQMSTRYRCVEVESRFSLCYKYCRKRIWRRVWVLALLSNTTQVHNSALWYGVSFHLIARPYWLSFLEP
ncbi:hypothetical protein LAZ67_6001657 [Cordylochernes scorpioides]|uniref:Secreted protein n=1 Tax=Cordylochernes scorpioides TaxID=51811 RepID=A0ABY6KJM2_9ARAC|nr:hypothetical protein LAZ67_6001657 [Cordylochernes scorpioides]